MVNRCHRRESFFSKRRSFRTSRVSQPLRWAIVFSFPATEWPRRENVYSASNYGHVTDQSGVGRKSTEVRICLVGNPFRQERVLQGTSAGNVSDWVPQHPGSRQLWRGSRLGDVHKPESAAVAVKPDRRRQSAVGAIYRHASTAKITPMPIRIRPITMNFDI